MKWLKSYLVLDRDTSFLILAELMVQLVNTAFLTVLNLFMLEKDYSETSIAGFVSYRFLVVIPLAFPLGLFIKGRPMRNLLYIACTGVCLFGTGIVYSVAHHLDAALAISLTCWGASFTFMQVLAIPFILRHSPEDKRSEAISLSYATYSMGTIISGSIIFLLSKLNPVFFTEETLLYIIIAISSIGILFVRQISKAEKVPSFDGQRSNLAQYEWTLILFGLTPTFILAIGSGLAIQFMNLFFHQLFRLESSEYALLNGFSFVLVAISTLAVPFVKRKYGYGIAMIAVQMVAIMALIAMASTAFFTAYAWALPAAILFFLIRQPLMNMAAPLTTEVVMTYVGPKNHEMVSALTASIWSGSWFISSLLFKFFRHADISYGWIFMLTGALYSVGVFLYYQLIKRLSTPI